MAIFTPIDELLDILDRIIARGDVENCPDFVNGEEKEVWLNEITKTTDITVHHLKSDSGAGGLSKETHLVVIPASKSLAVLRVTETEAKAMYYENIMALLSNGHAEVPNTLKSPPFPCWLGRKKNLVLLEYVSGQDILPTCATFPTITEELKKYVIRTCAPMGIPCNTQNLGIEQLLRQISELSSLPLSDNQAACYIKVRNCREKIKRKSRTIYVYNTPVLDSLQEEFVRTKLLALAELAMPEMTYQPLANDLAYSNFRSSPEGAVYADIDGIQFSLSPKKGSVHAKTFINYTRAIHSTWFVFQCGRQKDMPNRLRKLQSHFPLASITLKPPSYKTTIQ